MRYEYKLKEPSFSIGNIDILNVQRPKGYKHFYRNGRVKNGFVYNVQGKLKYTFINSSEKDIIVEQDEMIFLPKGTVYCVTYFEDGTETKVVEFDVKKGELPRYLSSPCKISFPDAGEQINAFFTPLKNHVFGHPFYFLSRLYSLLWKIDENTSKIPTKYKKLKSAISRINERYNENEKVSFYAQLCDMSEVSFRRLFNEYTGQSPIDYRNGIRLENAKIKLQSGEYNVSEAAEASGFTNLSFFIRLYKKKYGVTPKKE